MFTSLAAPMPENTFMAKHLEENKGAEGKKKKKTKKHKDQTWAKEGPQDPFEMLDSLPEEKQQEIQKALHLFSFGQGPPKSLLEAQKHTYRFWDTQPVPKIGMMDSAQLETTLPVCISTNVIHSLLDEKVTSYGPIKTEMPSVREESYSLPQEFIWDTLDLDNQKQLRELCDLLNENYTEEDDNTLRLHYSPQFLLWALCPPGGQSQWHCGVRVNSSQKLVGFISAIPATMKVFDIELKMVEVNFLCVHKKLRSKRVAPVLIKEITRRVRQQGISQAVYSTSAVLPKPIATCRYWHRSLNPRKLIELNFFSLTHNMTLQRALKLNRLPETTKTTGLRPMTVQDVQVVQALLKEHLKAFHLSPVLTLEDVEHWLLPQDGVIDTYVVESMTGTVTDMVSFYTLPSTALNHPVHKDLKAACVLYCISKATPLLQLMEDTLIICKARGFDVFSAMDVMDNKAFLEPLKFRMGEVHKQYYLYNWRCPEISSDKVGVVLK
ncbi:glycylpeptide N-tetradecanoyltransferase 1b isoform X2 [Pimephales promelas]|uniref:glycylpeptide N-tetradecanoyltransferase 1b isoform X2 n=1 Tax=Pimephales promelas TaxID=90988 RepID=UPI001955AE8E|nr:glycylpeptide N-tetradecanoyltransferase 1b isoform X2 [Pimephales promelas]